MYNSQVETITIQLSVTAAGSRFVIRKLSNVKRNYGEMFVTKGVIQCIAIISSIQEMNIKVS